MRLPDDGNVWPFARSGLNRHGAPTPPSLVARPRRHDAATRTAQTFGMTRKESSVPTLDEEIARRLEESMACGELQSAPSFGKPLAEMQGWDATPEELRMPFKILKDSGFFPPEILLFHERAALRASVEAASDPSDRQRLQQQLSELEQKIALRLEALRVHTTL